MSFFQWLPSLALTVATGNPMFLASAAAGKGAEMATGSPTVGKIASIATGGIPDPSTIAPALMKEAGTTVLERTGPTGQAISTGIRAGSALQSATAPTTTEGAVAPVTPEVRPAIEPSGFSKALPYAALAVPALASLAKTGKITPGLQAGSQLLQGVSAIKNMAINEAQEKDRATVAAMEIKALKAEDERLSKKTDPRMSLTYRNIPDSIKPLVDEKINMYADEKGMIDLRTQQKILNDLKYDVGFKEEVNKILVADIKTQADVEYDKLKKIEERLGKDSPEYKEQEKKYTVLEDRYHRTAENTSRENEALRKREEKINALYDKYTPESVDAYKKDPTVPLVPLTETKEKIPIQSDKLQGAMAELEIDIRDPENYTPENISRATARLRSMEAQERKERGEELTSIQRSSVAHQLRTELRQDKYVQDFKDVDNKYQVMERALTKAGTKPESYVAVDQALITLYNKMTDPTSVVRESEYARTPENMSIANRIVGKLDKWRQGGAGLTDVERKALIEMAREFHRGYAENYDQIVSDFEQTATESGIDPKLIGIPYKRKSTTKAPPQGGETMRVKLKGTGQTGTIPVNEFDEKIYERLP